MNACARCVTLCLESEHCRTALSLSLFICVAALNLTCACSCFTGLQLGTKVSMRHSETRPAHVHAVPVCTLHVPQAAAGLSRTNRNSTEAHTVGSDGTQLRCRGSASCQPHCLCCMFQADLSDDSTCCSCPSNACTRSRSSAASAVAAPASAAAAVDAAVATVACASAAAAAVVAVATCCCCRFSCRSMNCITAGCAALSSAHCSSSCIQTSGGVPAGT